LGIIQTANNNLGSRLPQDVVSDFLFDTSQFLAFYDMSVSRRSCSNKK